MQNALEVSIEYFAIGWRDFEPERIITGPRDLAPNFPRRAGDEPGQQLSFAIFDGPRDRHGTCSILELLGGNLIALSSDIVSSENEGRCRHRGVTNGDRS